jgi:glycosyltransferase involved in cell wall biosynthesis
MFGSIKTIIGVLRADGFEITLGKLIHRFSEFRERPKYERWIVENESLSEAELKALKVKLEGMLDRPLISVLMPVYNTDAGYLTKAIESVRSQVYDNWELCIADDHSTAPHIRPILEQYVQSDPRIKVIFREENGHISAASNSALDLATGEFTALLDHDDELSPLALYFVAKTVNEFPDAGILYSDEDKIDARGRRYAPRFKTDWNPDMLLSLNYVNHLTVYRTSLIRECGGFRSGFDGSQDYDLLLRASELCGSSRIHHIPKVLYHWRAIAGSVAHTSDEKPYAHDLARKAIAEHLDRVGTPGTVVRGFGQLHRVNYDISEPVPRISFILDGPPTSSKVIEDMKRACGRIDCEIILISTETDQGEQVTVVDPGSAGRFENFNRAAAAAKGAILCFIDRSFAGGSEDWIETLAGYALRKNAGAVGPMIIGRDGRIVNAGYVLGIAGDVVSAFRGHRLWPSGRSIRLDVAQNVSAVSAECMVVSKEAFTAAGGFDASTFPDHYADVDLCLRLMAKNLRNVFVPFAEVTANPPEMADQESLEVLKHRHPTHFEADPFYNPNLTLEDVDLAITMTPRIEKI